MNDRPKATIYADYNGSAPPLLAVKEYLIQRLQSDDFANPNASHELGEKLNRKIEKSRKRCAQTLGARPQQIIFNSGSTEGITHIFHSLLDGVSSAKKIITSSIEHVAVLQTAHYWQSKGHQVVELSCDCHGLINQDELATHLKNSHGEIALVSLMATNNETGVIQPYRKMAALCSEYQVPLFSDTTQIIGKMPFNFEQSGLEFAVASSHKVGGLIGSGLIMAKNAGQLKPFIFGGGQERGLRSGTQNYLACETFGLALEELGQHRDQLDVLNRERKQFEQKLKAAIDCLVIGEGPPRVPSTSLLAFPGKSGKLIQLALELKGIMVTTTSACSDRKEDRMSHVLKAMGFGPEIGQSVVRIGLGTEDPKTHYVSILDALTAIVKSM